MGRKQGGSYTGRHVGAFCRAFDGERGKHDTSLWFYTNKVDELYQLLKARQLEAAKAAMEGAQGPGPIEFEQDIEDMFYGARQFCIRDLNGYSLYFIQPIPQR